MVGTERTPARGWPLFLLVAPAGSGKTTLLARVLEQRPALARLLTATTRPPRTGERDGTDYHFVDRETFARWAAEDALIEQDEHYGSLYGVPRSALDVLRTRPGVCVVDINGAATLMGAYAWTVPIFIQPPSQAEAARRLSARASDTGTDERLARMDHEWEVASHYPDRVVNADVAEATTHTLAIIDREIARAG